MLIYRLEGQRQTTSLYIYIYIYTQFIIIFFLGKAH